MILYDAVLSIAGSDPSAGAGIQADLKTFTALGCYGTTVITGLTAQNTNGLQAVLTVPDRFITQQLQSLFSDIPIRAVKIGMLGNADNVSAVAHYFKQIQLPLVLDPVMVAKGGELLLAYDAIHALRSDLMPSATLVTPNIPEAECLIEGSIRTTEDMQAAARHLCELGARAVLLKGSHLQGEPAQDYLYEAATQQSRWYVAPRINTRNVHGTGCTFSTAITALLAKGLPLGKAIAQAKTYLSLAIQSGADYSLGSGQGPVQHFYKYWEQK